MNPQTLRGMAVVDLSGAERLGRVADVLFETDPLKLSGFVLRDGTSERVLDFGNISEIGPDAIVTREQPVTDDLERGRHGRPGLDELARLKVMDEGGRFKGYIAGVRIDPNTGAVSEVHVRKGDVLGFGGETQTVDPGGVVAIGADLVVIQRDSPPLESNGEASRLPDAGQMTATRGSASDSP